MTDHSREHDSGSTSWMRKLSPAARQLAADPAVSLKDLGETDVLVRTTRTVSTTDRARLETAGATVRSIAGDVLTARIPFTRIEALARLEFVAYVELSRPLRTEKGEGG